MPVPVATSSTRSSGCAPTDSTRARRHRGSWPRDRRVATRSYDTAMPANRPRAWRERAETTVSPDGVALVIDIASAGAAILMATLSDQAGRSNAVRGILLEDRERQPQGRQHQSHPQGRGREDQGKGGGGRRRRVQVDVRVDDERPLGYRPC